MIEIEALSSKIIPIGRLGENEHCGVLFSVAEYLRMYPDATFTLLNLRPGEAIAYPVANTAVEGTHLRWTVTSADLTKQGAGKCELLVMQGDVIAKSVIFSTFVMPALDGSGEAPEPWESWQERFAGLVEDAENAAREAAQSATDATTAADQAEAASQAVQDMGVEAETLAPGSAATVGKTVDPQTGVVTLEFGIPAGERGIQGETGPQGAQGEQGPKGDTGATGPAGEDGFSPTITVTDIAGGHRVTITDETGPHSFDVMDGTGSVQDVQVAGMSVVQDGVANVPLASPNVPGVIMSGTIAVSGTTPTITALPGIRYVCGEVATLDITLPASGIVDVVFESGSTPTVLTVTPPTGVTVQWANGFDPTSLEANTTYEVNVMDGCLGVVGTWN